MFVMFIKTVLGLHLLVAVEIAVSQKASTFTILKPQEYLFAGISHMIGVVTHPQSMNVSLNGFAMLNCTAIASLITWEIDGLLIDSDIRDKGFDDSAFVVTLNLTQDLHDTLLRVLGSPDSNNVSITCLAIIPITPFTNDVNTSEPALMLVQGKSVGMHVQNACSSQLSKTNECKQYYNIVSSSMTVEIYNFNPKTLVLAP